MHTLFLSNTSLTLFRKIWFIPRKLETTPTKHKNSKIRSYKNREKVESRTDTLTRRYQLSQQPLKGLKNIAKELCGDPRLRTQSPP